MSSREPLPVGGYLSEGMAAVEKDHGGAVELHTTIFVTVDETHAPQEHTNLPTTPMGGTHQLHHHTAREMSDRPLEDQGRLLEAARQGVGVVSHRDNRQSPLGPAANHRRHEDGRDLVAPLPPHHEPNNNQQQKVPPPTKAPKWRDHLWRDHRFFIQFSVTTLSFVVILLATVITAACCIGIIVPLTMKGAREMAELTSVVISNATAARLVDRLEVVMEAADTIQWLAVRSPALATPEEYIAESANSTVIPSAPYVPTWADAWYRYSMVHGRKRTAMYRLSNQLTFVFDHRRRASCAPMTLVPTGEYMCTCIDRPATWIGDGYKVWSIVNFNQNGTLKDYVYNTSDPGGLFYSDTNAWRYSMAWFHAAPRIPFAKQWMLKPSVAYYPVRPAINLIFPIFNRTQTFVGAGVFEVSLDFLKEVMGSLANPTQSRVVITTGHNIVLGVSDADAYTDKRVGVNYQLTAEEIAQECLMSSRTNAKAFTNSTARVFCTLPMGAFGLTEEMIGAARITDDDDDEGDDVDDGVEHTDGDTDLHVDDPDIEDVSTVSSIRTSAATPQLHTVFGKKTWVSVTHVYPSNYRNEVFKIAVLVNDETITTKINGARDLALIVCCVVTFVVLIFVMVITRLVLRPLAKVAHNMRSGAFFAEEDEAVTDQGSSSNGTGEEEDLSSGEGEGRDKNQNHKSGTSKAQKFKKKAGGVRTLSYLADVAAIEVAWYRMLDELKALRGYIPEHVRKELVEKAAQQRSLQYGNISQHNASGSHLSGSGGRTGRGGVGDDDDVDESFMFAGGAADDPTTGAEGRISPKLSPLTRLRAASLNRSQQGKGLYSPRGDDVAAAGGATAAPEQQGGGSAAVPATGCPVLCPEHLRSLEMGEVPPNANQSAQRHQILLQQKGRRDAAMLTSISSPPADPLDPHGMPTSLHPAPSVTVDSHFAARVASLGDMTLEAERLNRPFYSADGPIVFGDNVLVDRDVTVACVNINGFHNYALVTHGAELARHHAAVVTFVYSTAAKYGGVLDTFSGDKFWVSFNATTKCDRGEVAAICFALELTKTVNSEAAIAREALEKERQLREANKLPSATHRYKPRFRAALNGLTVGIANGRAYVGPLGTSAIRRHSIISNAVTEAAALERLCGRYPNTCIIAGGDVLPAIEGYCQYLILDALILPGSNGKRRRIASIKEVMCGNGCDPSLVGTYNTFYSSSYGAHRHHNCSGGGNTGSSSNSADSSGISQQQQQAPPPPAKLVSAAPATGNTSSSLAGITANKFKLANDLFSAFLEGRSDECSRLVDVLDGMVEEGRKHLDSASAAAAGVGVGVSGDQQPDQPPTMTTTNGNGGTTTALPLTGASAEALLSAGGVGTFTGGVDGRKSQAPPTGTAVTSSSSQQREPPLIPPPKLWGEYSLEDLAGLQLMADLVTYLTNSGVDGRLYCSPLGVQRC